MTTAPDYLDSVEFRETVSRLGMAFVMLPAKETEDCIEILKESIREHFVSRENDDDALTAAYLLGYEDGLAGKEKRKL